MLPERERYGTEYQHGCDSVTGTRLQATKTD